MSTKIRPLTENEFKYCWYIEYGEPYHYIPDVQGKSEVGAVIKRLVEDGICIYLPNPTKEKSPLYCRFTPQGRVLFLAHECMMLFRHSTQLEPGATYDDIIADNDFEKICFDMGCFLNYLTIASYNRK